MLHPLLHLHAALSSTNDQLPPPPPKKPPHFRKSGSARWKGTFTFESLLGCAIPARYCWPQYGRDAKLREQDEELRTRLRNTGSSSLYSRSPFQICLLFRSHFNISFITWLTKRHGQVQSGCASNQTSELLRYSNYDSIFNHL